MLAIELGEKVTLNTARHEGDLFTRLRRHFSDQEIVELAMAAALWNLTNRLNETFHTPLEEPASGGRPVTEVPQEALLEYVRRVTAPLPAEDGSA